MTTPGECSTRPSTGHQAPLWGVALVVLIFGILARCLYLEHLPAYIHNDESATAVYITPPFFADPPDPIMWGQNNFGGHANFGAWLASLSLRYLGGKTLLAIRMGSMVCGVLSILFGALFVRSWLGLRAMVFFLVGVVPFHLHLHFSRTGFIYIQAVLFISLVAYCFGRFSNKPSIANGLALGVVTGLALMVYSATHVLVGVLPVSILAVLLSHKAKNHLPRHRLIKSFVVILAFMAGLSATFGQFAYHAYTDGFSSRFEQQSIFREEVRQEASKNIGRDLSYFELAHANFQSTLSFFWDGDCSVQYGLTASPLEGVSSAILILGLGILLLKCVRLEPCALFLATLIGGTMAGSSLMVERNFAPHMVAYGLLLPMLGALALETVCSVVGIRWHLLGALVAVVAFIPWASWNYELYTTLDKQKRNMDTFILHLPIQREGVKHIVNYSTYIADLAESFYMLRYPNAKILKMGDSKGTDIPAHISQLIRSGECPCLAIVPAFAADAVEQSIHETSRKFTKLTFQPVDAKIVYVE
jgi:Dolichyl-phosphate-mannose-protein mannosyltransferase